MNAHSGCCRTITTRRFRLPAIVLVAILAAMATAARPATDRYLLTPDPRSPLQISEVLHRPDGGRAESAYFPAGRCELDVAAGVISGTDLNGAHLAIPLARVVWLRVIGEIDGEPRAFVLRPDALIEPAAWSPGGHLIRIALQGGTVIEFEGVEPTLRSDAREYTWDGTGNCLTRIAWHRVHWVEYLRQGAHDPGFEVESEAELRAAVLRDGETVNLTGRRGCLDAVAGRLRSANPDREIPLSEVRVLRIAAAPGAGEPAAQNADTTERIAATLGVETGDRLRVTMADPAGDDRRVVTGHLKAADNATLTLAADRSGDTLVIPRRDIEALETCVQPGRKGVGGAIGLGVGVALGYLVGMSMGDDEPGIMSLTAENKAAAGAVVFGLIGALAGSLGAPGEAWETVPGPGVRVGLSRDARGNTGVAVTWSF